MRSPIFVYSGLFERVVRQGLTAWRDPGGDALAAVDLRSFPQQSDPGPSPQGIGLFAYRGERTYPQLQIAFGSDLSRSVNKTQRDGLETSLGLRIGATKESRLPRLIRELLLSDDDGLGKPLWDASGQDSYRPLTGSLQKGVRLAFDDLILFDEAFTQDHPAFKTSIAVFQADYRRNRSHVDLGFMPLSALRRFTGATMLKLFGRMGDDLIGIVLPSEHQEDGFDIPLTDLGDTYVVGANIDLRFHTATGPNSGFAWTRIFGDINVNAAADEARSDFSGANNAYRADADLSTDEQSVAADVDASEEVNLAAAGLMARKDSSGVNTFYFARALFNSNEIDVFKDVAGVFTQLGATIPGVVLTAGIPANFRMEVLDDGGNTNVEVFVNDVSQGVRTDTPTAISGNLRIGLFSRKSVVGFVVHDNLVAFDFVAPSPPIAPTLPQYGQTIIQPTGPEYAQSLSETGDTFPQYGQIIKVDPKPQYAQEFLKEADDDQYGQRIVRD